MYRPKVTRDVPLSARSINKSMLIGFAPDLITVPVSLVVQNFDQTGHSLNSVLHYDTVLFIWLILKCVTFLRNSRAGRHST